MPALCFSFQLSFLVESRKYHTCVNKCTEAHLYSLTFFVFILFRANIMRKKYITECNELSRLAEFLRMFLEVCFKLHKDMELQELQKAFNTGTRFM